MSKKDLDQQEFEERLNALLNDFKNLPKKEIIDTLAFYLNVTQKMMYNSLIGGRAFKKSAISKMADARYPVEQEHTDSDYYKHFGFIDGAVWACNEIQSILSVQGNDQKIQDVINKIKEMKGA